MDLENVQKQGRDERTQEEIPYICKIHSRCRVVFLLFSSLPCFCSFQVHSYLKWSFAETFFLSFCFFFFGEFLNQHSNRRWTRYALEMNTLVLEMRVQTLGTHTASCVWVCACVTSKQTLCWDDCYSQVLTFENRWYYGLVLTSEYATPTSYIYAVAFSVGLKYVLGEKTAGKTWITFPFYMRS